ncbi:hypothetical protein BV898_06744 [Hypsibius exemplaris]|uniref:Uncharacterized protein n=1 Tax=Hypsibius exemplaris TaxID=2072580 RepID=A0A1W0WV81_HYPEX|nr:hypothetical protein BV898_06744 [Hypsibius exemplaris]
MYLLNFALVILCGHIASASFQADHSHGKKMAEQTWNTLAKYCSTKTMRCDGLPLDWLMLIDWLAPDDKALNASTSSNISSTASGKQTVISDTATKNLPAWDNVFHGSTKTSGNFSTPQPMDLLIEDTRIRYRSTSAPAPLFTTTSNSLVCPPCSCASSTATDPEKDTLTRQTRPNEIPIAVDTFLWKPSNHSQTSDFAPTLKPGKLEVTAPSTTTATPVPPSSVYPSDGSSSPIGQSPPASSAVYPFDQTLWQNVQGRNPVDPYVRQIMQGALQKSGLGFVFERPSMTTGQQTASALTNVIPGQSLDNPARLAPNGPFPPQPNWIFG